MEVAGHRIHLEGGSHTDRSGGLNILEAICLVQGEAHSDRPTGVCPVLGEFAYWINMSPFLDQIELDEYVYPLLRELQGSCSPTSEKARAECLVRGAEALGDVKPRYLRVAKERLAAGDYQGAACFAGRVMFTEVDDTQENDSERREALDEFVRILRAAKGRV
jgi:hypothetical protein